jgi:hypothetical protein
MSIPARTDATLVQEILQRDYRAGAPLTIPIRAGSALMDQVIACAADKGASFTEEEAQLMETYLAAFFYQMNDKGYTSRRTGSASGNFAGQWGKYLESNNYGQAAMVLDKTGCLHDIAQGVQEATGRWLGKRPSQQTPYDQRD